MKSLPSCAPPNPDHGGPSCLLLDLPALFGALTGPAQQALHDRGVRFHDSLVEAPGNAFFIDAMRRVSRARRLPSYRSMRQRNAEAAAFLREHPDHTMQSLSRIENILQP